MVIKRISRRSFLRSAGVSALAVLGGGLSGYRPWNAGSKSRVFHLSARKSVESPGKKAAFEPDAEISITAVEKNVQILPRNATRAWGYEGELLSGSGITVTNLPNNYLGPILRAKSGTKLRINFHNNLRERSIMHPHGLLVPEDCDGSPMDSIDPGQTKVYDFQVINHAGPYWFHPHPMDRTAEQVYLGLAGLFYVWDEDEEKAVPGSDIGANDIPVIIQDRIFDNLNQFSYRPNMMMGMLGDRILVNGVLDASCGLEPRAYRLRLLNGSNARSYKLVWSNGMPLMAIGTDGGLLPEAQTRSYIMLMPGERVDLWVDFSDLSGGQVVLQSQPFDSGMGMGMGMMHGSMMRGRGMGVMNGSGTSSIDILRVNVGKSATIKPVLGPLPPLSIRYNSNNVTNFDNPTQFTLGMGMMMSWTINGRLYEMEAYTQDEQVMKGEVVAWEFINQTPIPHPMHIHNTQFQVIDRMPSSLSSYASIQEGLLDGGWKDTVLVWPGERVKIAMQFGPETGMYMYHCHILEHEDMGMMRNLMVMDMEM